MKEIFETFKPQNPVVKKFVDYYYIDIKPTNTNTEFQCFPHFNNTISLYQSHIRLENGAMKFVAGPARPFQIFTPIRDKVLTVKQSGKVFRIVIVFHPLGVQQFYKNVNFSDYITDYAFFSPQELKDFFSTTETTMLTGLLDSSLEKRFERFENMILEKSIQYIFNHHENFSVTAISCNIGVSRQHLNRVFQSHLGISVKKFHEIVLFRQSLNKKLFENPGRSFTKIAYDFNFSDQSHFNKTYKNLTANSPKSFFTKGIVLGKEDTFWHLKP
ncbi:helix-turn-helix domain-containing protein [Terrimonas rubra]|uniref:Helix-turn-helix domain-containing protein n=1 Tax=Terrimonas rubra TaxID=1035890 RepID=A0ABW6A866_9BACT